jgi:hypothetical protein
LDPARSSRYNLTEFATTSFVQSKVGPATPPNASSRTTTGSIADAVNTTSIDETPDWSKR